MNDEEIFEYCRISQLQTSKIYTFHPGVSIVANTMKRNAYELE